MGFDRRAGLLIAIRRADPEQPDPGHADRQHQPVSSRSRACASSLCCSPPSPAATAWFFLHDYQKERVFTFLNPERDPLGAAYHAIQSQIAVGSGGLFGKGFGQGSQSQLDFLPEQQTDFVFSVLGEEWGFVGTATVLVLYLGILIRGLMIAHSSKDLFGAYLSIGIVALFFWAGAINVGMVIGVVPVGRRCRCCPTAAPRCSPAWSRSAADERLHAPLRSF
jgi:hypothetical protein